MVLRDTLIEWEANVEHLQEKKEAVRAAMAGFSDDEYRVISQKVDRIVLINNPENLNEGWYNEKERCVYINCAQHSIGIPVLNLTDFCNVLAVTTHELAHPLVDACGSARKLFDSDFSRARKAAQDRLIANPSIRAKLKEVLPIYGAMAQRDSHTKEEQEKFYEKIKAIDYGWNKMDPYNQEQLGVTLGIFLSHEYHLMFKYRPLPSEKRIKTEKTKQDASYAEMICNIRALTSLYGEEKMCEFAPELVDYCKNLVHAKKNPVKENAKQWVL